MYGPMKFTKTDASVNGKNLQRTTPRDIITACKYSPLSIAGFIFKRTSP